MINNLKEKKKKETKTKKVDRLSIRLESHLGSSEILEVKHTSCYTYTHTRKHCPQVKFFFSSFCFLLTYSMTCDYSFWRHCFITSYTHEIHRKKSSVKKYIKEAQMRSSRKEDEAQEKATDGSTWVKTDS